MNPTPTGHFVITEAGADLVLTRRFRAPLTDVWESVTDPDSTARWIGRWEGAPGAGNTVQLTMGMEEGSPTSSVTIQVCEPPRHLVVTSNDSYGAWHMELTLTREGGETVLTFVQHLTDLSMVADIGPGWEYYLDLLVAAREGTPQRPFSDYHPGQKQYFLDALKAAQK